MSPHPSSTPLNLDWERRPLRELLRLSVPTTVSMLSYSLMTLVGTLFVGRLGPSALAAVGLAGTLVFFLLGFSFGLFRGLKVLVSQAVGARAQKDIPRQLAAGLWASLGLGLLTIAAGQVLAELLPALSVDASADAQMRRYLHVRNLAAPLVLCAAAIREVRYGLSDTRSGMVASLAANVVNAALDYVLLVRVGTGVEGAAWAAFAAHAVEAGVLLWLQRRTALGLSFQVDRTALADLWRVGWPTGTQFLLEVGSFAVLSVMVARMGVIDMSAHQVALTLIHVSFLPAFAISQSVSVLCGQARGARRLELIRPLALQALWVAGAYTAACSVLFAAAGGPLARTFTPDPALARAVVSLLYVAAAFQVLDAAAMVARGALQGVGDVRYTAVTGIAVSWLSLPPLAWALGLWWGLGAVGAWLGLCVEIAFAAALFWRRLASGTWKTANAAATPRQAVPIGLAAAE